MLNEILRICAITSLIIVVLLFLKTAKGNKNSWIAIAFTVSVISYLCMDWLEEVNSIFLSIWLIGPILLPVFFWLFSKSIFDDHFRMNKLYYVFIFIFLLVQYVSFFTNGDISFSVNTKSLILLIPKLLSFVFMLLGVLEAVRNRKHDLIDTRLRFRNSFIIITASLIAITLIVEIIGIGRATPEILPTIQKGTIALLTLYFIYYNFQLKPGFFIQPDKEEKLKIGVEINRQVAAKITRLLAEEKVYLIEGLTIGQLAEMLKEQEYRVRQTINGQLGFRNFNDFLNKYRVQEACTILENPEKVNLTILEIAYSLGYQSIGPFNKTFKDQTGSTPTTYRKQKLQLV